MHNADVARILDEVADLLAILGENPFRVRAYRRAARTVESAAVPVSSLQEGGLVALPGIGKDLAGKIGEILASGDLGLRKDLAAKVPPGLVDCLRVEGLGPRRVQDLHEALGIEDLDALETAAREGRIRKLRGFGKVLEERILRGVTAHRRRSGRHRLSDAEASIASYLDWLAEAEGLTRVEVAGSLRRRRATVGDVDVLASGREGNRIADRFLAFDDVEDVLASGKTRCSVRLRSGLQVDLRVVPPESWGAALVYFTGSKAHNVALRKRGVQRGLKINEYGVYRGARRLGGGTERDVYKAVGLPWIPPELREDRGEIAAALDKRLPRLVTADDLRGDLHVHTKASDGHDTVEAMARAAKSLGYAYLAITDHTRAARIAGGLDPKRYRRHLAHLDRVQARLRGIRILKGAEVDILDEGRLDLPDAILDLLDVVVVAVHSGFAQSAAKMTRRVIKALQHPRVHVFAHPTGRLLGRREPYAIDLREVTKAARDHGVWLEMNAQPDRLDLDDAAAFAAREAGVGLVIGSDAHRTADLDLIRGGVDQARRAWCRASDIVNTLPLARLLKRLEAKR